MERMISIPRAVFRRTVFDTEGGGGEDASEGSIIYCNFALIKLTSELHIDIMKQQPGFQIERAQAGSFLSNQAIAVYNTQRRAVRFAMQAKPVKT